MAASSCESALGALVLTGCIVWTAYWACRVVSHIVPRVGVFFDSLYQDIAAAIGRVYDRIAHSIQETCNSVVRAYRYVADGAVSIATTISNAVGPVLRTANDWTRPVYMKIAEIAMEIFYWVTGRKEWWVETLKNELVANSIPDVIDNLCTRISHRGWWEQIIRRYNFWTDLAVPFQQDVLQKLNATYGSTNPKIRTFAEKGLEWTCSYLDWRLSLNLIIRPRLLQDISAVSCDADWIKQIGKALLPFVEKNDEKMDIFFELLGKEQPYLYNLRVLKLKVGDYIEAVRFIENAQRENRLKEAFEAIYGKCSKTNMILLFAVLKARNPEWTDGFRLQYEVFMRSTFLKVPLER
ncbi:MAG TPA: hypothetical protein VN457_00890, partial [Chlamydiales bacterium]|nr:hypothetical protein [Chlamydiales bacterium]